MKISIHNKVKGFTKPTSLRGYTLGLKFYLHSPRSFIKILRYYKTFLSSKKRVTTDARFASVVFCEKAVHEDWDIICAMKLESPQCVWNTHSLFQQENACLVSTQDGHLMASSYFSGDHHILLFTTALEGNVTEVDDSVSNLNFIMI